MDGTCIGHAHDRLRADPEAGGRYLGLDELTQMDRLLNLHRHGAILKLLKGAIPTQKSPRCVGPGGSRGDSKAPPRHFDPFRGPLLLACDFGGEMGVLGRGMGASALVEKTGNVQISEGRDCKNKTGNVS